MIDGARGGPIRHHLQDIRSKMEDLADPGERLQPLLNHAARTTPFYRQWAGADLDEIPVIDRMTRKSRSIEFHSSAFTDARVHRMSTSGTSGSPMMIIQDRNKRQRSIADTIYFNQTFGQSVGDRLMWLRAWKSGEAKPRRVLIAQNIVPFEVRGMDDHVRSQIIDSLARGRINAILGYSSALSSLGRFIEEQGRDARSFGVRVLINDSETMHIAAKRRLEQIFGCPVVDRYANTENGILAATKPGGDEFRLNRASYWFEFLKSDSDEPETSDRPARIVVTDLYNYAMPFIRYDTGDMGVVTDHRGPDTLTLKRLDGRRLESIYDTAGRELTASMIATPMSSFLDLLQYQLRQEDAGEYRLLVEGARGVYRPDAFVAALTATLGADARISVAYVDSIPREANGKARTLVCNYAPGHSGGAKSP